MKHFVLSHISKWGFYLFSSRHPQAEDNVAYLDLNSPFFNVMHASSIINSCMHAPMGLFPNLGNLHQYGGLIPDWWRFVRFVCMIKFSISHRLVAFKVNVCCWVQHAIVPHRGHPQVAADGGAAGARGVRVPHRGGGRQADHPHLARGLPQEDPR